MSTTHVTTWSADLTQLGPVYPFVGTESLLWLAGLAFWIGFHVIQTRRENPELNEMLENIKASGQLGKHLE